MQLHHSRVLHRVRKPPLDLASNKPPTANGVREHRAAGTGAGDRHPLLNDLHRERRQVEPARLVVLRRHRPGLVIPGVFNVDATIAQIDVGPVQRHELTKSCARLGGEPGDVPVDGLIALVRNPKAS